MDQERPLSLNTQYVYSAAVSFFLRKNISFRICALQGHHACSTPALLHLQAIYTLFIYISRLVDAS